jgi:hypothetical protein
LKGNFDNSTNPLQFDGHVEGGAFSQPEVQSIAPQAREGALKACAGTHQSGSFFMFAGNRCTRRFRKCTT